MVVEGQATVVLLDTQYRPMKIPSFFRQSFTAYMDDSSVSVEPPALQ